MFSLMGSRDDAAQVTWGLLACRVPYRYNNYNNIELETKGHEMCMS